MPITIPKTDPNLRVAIARMEATLSELGEPPKWTPRTDASHSAWRAWWDNGNLRLMDAVVDAGGYLLSTKMNTSRIVLAGVTSTCTSGHRGAVGNWLIAARRKLQADEKATAA